MAETAEKLHVCFLKDQLKWHFTWNQIFWGSPWTFQFMFHPERNDWVSTKLETSTLVFWGCSSLLSTALKISYFILRKATWKKPKSTFPLD